MFIKKVFRHIWPTIKQYKWSLIGAFAFFALGVVFDFVLKGFLLQRIIDFVASNETDRSTIAPELINLLTLTSLCLVGSYIFYRLGSLSHTYFKNNVMRELSNYSFQKITNHSYSFFTNHFSGGLVSKSKRFNNGLRTISNVAVFSLWNTLVITVGSLVVIFKQAPLVGAIFLAWIVVYVFVVLMLIKVKFPYDLLTAKADSRVGGRLADVFTNMITLKVFSARSREIESFKKITQEESEHRGKSWNIGIRQQAIKTTLVIFVQLMLLFISIKLWISGEISTGTIVLVQTYMVAIVSRLWDLDFALVGLMENMSEMSEAVDLFEITPEILDKDNPEPSRMNKGNIEFKNVSFIYDSGKDVFENFCLKIKSGERVGVVGHSGAGKSTITKLLLRFLEVSSGSIEIDGQNIKNVTQDDLRKSVAYVPQESVLFHRTIRENIVYGNPDSSEENMIAAAKRAHAHEFISILKKGYDTLVGERGVKLSGGERQRIAIARVMLTESPILILDEATSSLDSISESLIQDAFEELMKGRTTIVIAHRLSTIQKMDRIIVLDKGVIVEEGTHRELLDKNGFYADLWNRQSGGFLE